MPPRPRQSNSSSTFFTAAVAAATGYWLGSNQGTSYVVHDPAAHQRDLTARQAHRERLYTGMRSTEDKTPSSSNEPGQTPRN